MKFTPKRWNENILSSSGFLHYEFRVLLKCDKDEKWISLCYYKNRSCNLHHIFYFQKIIGQIVNRAQWEQLWWILNDFGVPHYLIGLIKSLYTSNEGKVKVGDKLSGEFNNVTDIILLTELFNRVYNSEMIG